MGSPAPADAAIFNEYFGAQVAVSEKTSSQETESKEKVEEIESTGKFEANFEEKFETKETWKVLGERFSDRTTKAKAMEYGVAERYVEDIDKTNKLITIESIADQAESCEGNVVLLRRASSAGGEGRASSAGGEHVAEN
eukprot:2537915-Rhodomonas_salina.4